jgi:hypothetical protein
MVWLIHKMWRFIARLAGRVRTTFLVAPTDSDPPRLPR